MGRRQYQRITDVRIIRSTDVSVRLKGLCANGPVLIAVARDAIDVRFDLHLAASNQRREACIASNLEAIVTLASARLSCGACSKIFIDGADFIQVVLAVPDLITLEMG